MNASMQSDGIGLDIRGIVCYFSAAAAERREQLDKYVLVEGKSFCCPHCAVHP